MRLQQIFYFGRIVALALFSVGGAIWALHRYYTHPHQPVVVMVPASAPTYDADAGEMPVPEEYLLPAETSTASPPKR